MDEEIVCPLCGRTFFVNTNPFCDDCLALADDIRENIQDEVQIYGKEFVETTVYRPIMGFPSYEVNAEGVLRNRRTKEPLKTHRKLKRGVRGAVQVTVWNNETRMSATVTLARLVAAAFLEEYLDSHGIEYIDGNPENLNVENLRVGSKLSGPKGRSWKHEWVAPRDFVESTE